MKKSIQTKDSSRNYYFDDIKICPICKHNISPDYIAACTHSNDTQLSILCKCTACDKGFIVFFSKITKNPNAQYICTDIEYSAPSVPQKVKFDNLINNLSPNFVNIYNEAHIAEESGLNSICGIGYRKSVEFLIKDYCMHTNPNDSDKIKIMPLGQVIDAFISALNLKNLAKASAWLGNDETHYIKKFENRDINDLKKFINATVAYITYELISEDANSMVVLK